MAAIADSQILSLVAWSAWENGRISEAAAMGMVLMVMMTAIVVLARVVTLRLTREHG